MRNQPWGIQTGQGMSQSKSKEVGWRGAAWSFKEKGKRDLTLPQGACESLEHSHGEWYVWGEGKDGAGRDSLCEVLPEQTGESGKEQSKS